MSCCNSLRSFHNHSTALASQKRLQKFKKRHKHGFQLKKSLSAPDLNSFWDDDLASDSDLLLLTVSDKTILHDGIRKYSIQETSVVDVGVIQSGSTQIRFLEIGFPQICPRQIRIC